jgi:hypothetical protein
MKATPKGRNVKQNKMTKTLSAANTLVDEKPRQVMRERKVVLEWMGKKSKSQTPPFLLTFEIFNHNVHNYLVDFGASSNVMPYAVCKKLNA